MKTIKSFLLVAAIAFSGVLSANTNPETVKTTTAESTLIQNEVSKLLQNPGFLLDKEIIADVMITINKENELVVLSVDSEDEVVEAYIKNRLNYNELPKAIQSNEKTFKVSVRLEAELD